MKLGTSAIFAVAGSLTLLAMPNDATADGGESYIEWEACGPEFPGVDCATVLVPLDYDRPNGRKIELSLARYPASQPNRKKGTLFVNPGGPGGSGVALVQGGFAPFLDQQLRGRFDIVGFDPRGVAGSTPIQCFDTNEEQFDFLGGAPIFPYQPGQARPLFRLLRDYTRECLQRRQAILRNMGTANVARDLDFLRQAVGDRKLTYLGFSYGSFIGSMYANLFPNKVRALVIDGVLNPQLWSDGLQVISDRVATQEVFEEYARLCDLEPAGCALAGPGGSLARLEALAAALLKAPVVFPDGFAYSYDVFVADAASMLYAPSFWPLFAGFFADLASIATGSGTTTTPENVRAQYQRINELRRSMTLQREDIPYENGFDAFLGNLCADAQFPSSFAEFERRDRFAARGSIFGPFWWWGNTPCTNWPLGNDRYGGPFNTRTSSPVLVVGNFFDPATDYAGALSTSKLLKNSRLLSYAGWGHTAYGENDCITDHVSTYLISKRLPPKGTVCAANANPFAPAPAASPNARSAAFDTQASTAAHMYFLSVGRFGAQRR